VRHVGGQHQPQLGKDRTAQRKQTLFSGPCRRRAQNAALSVEVTDLDAGQLAAS
jgi:hypothetical protein